MPNLEKYIVITPLAILAFGGLFVITSLSNGGFLIEESFLIFIYGIISSFARQIYKDCTSSAEKLTWEWKIYYSFQIILFGLITSIIFGLGIDF